MATAPLKSPARIAGRDEVYVAAVPLRATRGPAQLLTSAAYSLKLWDFQHFMVIIRTSSPPTDSQAFVFDFQPEDPENAYVALAALSGRSIPGTVFKRKLTKLPKKRCWFVGSCGEHALDVAYKFSNHWETDLKIGHHDCRDYTNGLVEHLTGEKDVLERLRRSSGDPD
ncbi:uncharacterized protein LOC115726756 isoform X2 [Rhodamnia argentea]|uniref:Uncharacterized protein LOC115726756 isoform X3 n=1 Tax=Rhodamnia argentea TaxID=178133 RepID=A0A8B8MR54_9MYRT|nr:uncharacterized protein LOC115726756 isoform X2 [Rhodamnia argentea]XP_030512648.1 uncharacterized protein LOC115726756 isoform X2 [Rhodamnia argentea]XP_030512649.1 uncharacterized protein LOC115726756 isoform X2 [Rhodamnia argentea]